MRASPLLGSFVLFACAGAPAVPATQPSNPEPATPGPSDPESEPPEQPAPENEPAPSAEPTPREVDSCRKARDRMLECSKNDELSNATGNECKAELAAAPNSAEELARCLEELGCKALAKSKSTKDGALGICFIAAKRKMLDPDSP